MTVQFEPPPTYADVVLIDESTNHHRFNPIWLKWFVDLTELLKTSGTTSGGSSAITSVVGVLKSDGTTVSAATAGSDYLAPPAGTAILKGNSGGALTDAVAGTDYSAGTAVLTTGILKSTTTTGALSIAVGNDLPVMTATTRGAVPTPPNNTTTFLRGDGTFNTPPAGGSGTVTNTSGALTASAVMVGNGTADAKVLASLGTTTTVLHGNAAGLPSFSAVDLANDVSGNLAVAHLNSGTSASSATFWRGDSVWATPATGGIVNSVSVSTSNGLSGSSSGGANPILTLATTISGMLKGNGTTISAASSGSDYAKPSDYPVTGTPTSWYVTLPGGLIIQGGYITTGAGGTYNLYYPIAFPSACLALIVCPASLIPSFYNASSAIGNNVLSFIATANAGGAVSGTVYYICAGY